MMKLCFNNQTFGAFDHMGTDWYVHLWSCMAGTCKTDEVVVADIATNWVGKRNPNAIGGIASEILVSDGDRVEAGKYSCG